MYLLLFSLQQSPLLHPTFSHVIGTPDQTRPETEVELIDDYDDVIMNYDDDDDDDDDVMI